MNWVLCSWYRLYARKLCESNLCAFVLHLEISVQLRRENRRLCRERILFLYFITDFHRLLVFIASKTRAPEANTRWFMTVSTSEYRFSFISSGHLFKYRFRHAGWKVKKRERLVSVISRCWRWFDLLFFFHCCWRYWDVRSDLLVRYLFVCLFFFCFFLYIRIGCMSRVCMFKMFFHCHRYDLTNNIIRESGDTEISLLLVLSRYEMVCVIERTRSQDRAESRRILFAPTRSNVISRCKFLFRNFILPFS